MIGLRGEIWDLFFVHIFPSVSSVKSILGPMASTATFKFGLQISKAHGPTKGEGEWGVRGLSSQGLLKGPLFLLPSLRKKKFYPLLLWAFDAHSPYLLNSNFSGFGDLKECSLVFRTHFTNVKN